MLHDHQELNRQPVQRIPDKPSTVLESEQARSVTKGTSQQLLPLNAKDIISKDEEKIEDSVTVTDELNSNKGKDKSETTPSECKGPNSIHTMSQSSPDIRELKNHDEVHDDDVCLLGKDWNENVSFGGKKET